MLRPAIWSLWMGMSRNSTHVMRPVSPSPATVARNSGASGVSSSVSPEERCSSSRVTKRPKVPAAWWFLPCTSFATAPATVTYFVPGVTGRNHPCGTTSASTSASVTPASARTTPEAGVERDEPVQPGRVEDHAVLVEAGVAVGAALAVRQKRPLEAAEVGERAPPAGRDDARGPEPRRAAPREVLALGLGGVPRHGGGRRPLAPEAQAGMRQARRRTPTVSAMTTYDAASRTA